MKTLIELYDERAIENVIGPETFQPERVIYLCPDDIAANGSLQTHLKRFFQRRGLKAELLFLPTAPYRSDLIAAQLRHLAQEYPDCTLDITGGTEAALFAAGLFCGQSDTPVFTYSHKQNRFFSIRGADFADRLSCGLSYSVEEFFDMAGGTMRPGRVDNRCLAGYMDCYDPFFAVYLKYRRDWVSSVTWMQRISQKQDESDPLLVSGSWQQKGEHGGRIDADPACLRDLEAIGFINDLQLKEQESVSFRFADDQKRTWLRDVGSVLELYMYKACVDAGCFNDIVSSAVVDWDNAAGQDRVSNELDVVAARGIMPLFISCKTCEIHTEALNELAILRDRFGGKGAKAAIVTTEFCGAAARHRAAQLSIAVIDLEELKNGRAARRLQVIMKVRKSIESGEENN